MGLPMSPSKRKGTRVMAFRLGSKRAVLQNKESVDEVSKRRRPCVSTALAASRIRIAVGCANCPVGGIGRQHHAARNVLRAPGMPVAWARPLRRNGSIWIGQNHVESQT